MGIRNTVFTSAKWTGLASITGVLFQLVQTSILARMLTTADFGIMGLALVVIGFSQLFMDIGFSSVIIQKRDISPQQLSTVFWLSLLIGLLLFLLLFAVSPLIASFYDEPELIPVIRIIAAGFLLIPVESMFISLIQKNLEFKRIAQREILSRTIAFIAGLSAAYMGWGIYSLVVLHMTGIVISFLFIIKMGTRYFSPSRSFDLQSIRGFFSFGLYVMGDNIVNFFNRQIDVLIIGNQLGVQTLGIYNQGKNLAMRPYMVINPVITQISFPLLSRHKDDIATIKKLYLNTVTYLSFVNFPIYVFMAFFAEEVVLVLFGANWLGAIPVIRILSLTILIRAIINPMGGLLMAVGKPKWSFVWNLLVLLILPVLLFMAMPGGILVVCLIQLAFMFCSLYPCVKWLIGPVIKVRFLDFLKPLMAPLLYCAVAGLSWFIVDVLPLNGAFGKLIIAGLLFFGAYASLVLLFSKEISANLLAALKTKNTA